MSRTMQGGWTSRGDGRPQASRIGAPAHEPGLDSELGMDAREVDTGHRAAYGRRARAGRRAQQPCGACWHTYPDDSHTRYQFRYEPNVNKQIEERAETVPIEDARSDARTILQSYFSDRPLSSGRSVQRTGCLGHRGA